MPPLQRLSAAEGCFLQQAAWADGNERMPPLLQGLWPVGGGAVGPVVQAG